MQPRRHEPPTALRTIVWSIYQIGAVVCLVSTGVSRFDAAQQQFALTLGVGFALLAIAARK